MSKDKPKDAQQETRDRWFRGGHWLPRNDRERGRNEGLNAREISALDDENMRPWGQDMFLRGAIESRCKEAEDRRGKR